MPIDAVSQTTGAERAVSVEPAAAGLVLAIVERGTELTRVEVPTEKLLTVLTDRPEGVQAVVGVGKSVLEVEVRRNEVLLAVGRADAAVGLDDLMDAVAAALPAD
jgi:hypothetical protein